MNTEPDPEILPEHCAHFDSCSANKCPLDPLIAERNEESDDPECDMARQTRHGYWLNMTETEKALLPYEGYFEGEYRHKKEAKARWEAKSPEEKALNREKASKLHQYRMPTKPTASPSINTTTQGTPAPEAYTKEGNNAKP